MKVKALNPLYLDKPYKAGEILELPDQLASKWLELKYVEKAGMKEKLPAKKAAAKK